MQSTISLNCKKAGAAVTYAAEAESQLLESIMLFAYVSMSIRIQDDPGICTCCIVDLIPPEVMSNTYKCANQKGDSHMLCGSMNAWVDYPIRDTSFSGSTWSALKWRLPPGDQKI